MNPFRRTLTYAYAIVFVASIAALLHQSDELIAFVERSGLTADGKVGLPALLLFKLALLLFLPLPLLSRCTFVRDFKASGWPLERSEIVIILALLALHACSFFVVELKLLFMGEQAPLEIATAALALSAAVVLLFTLRRLAKRSSRALIAAAAAAFAWFALEEVSYGQHLMRFESPEFFARTNLQRETNLHNLVPVHGTPPFLFALGASAYFYLVSTGRRLFPAELGPATRPRNSALFAYVFLILAVGSSYAGGEPLEEVVSVMMLFGALRLARCLNARTLHERASYSAAQTGVRPPRIPPTGPS